MNPFLEAPIVVPVDLSEESLAAVEVALKIAEEPSRVHIVQILPEGQASSDLLWTAIDHAKRRNAAMEKLRSVLPDDKLGELKLYIDFGDPGHRIAQHAEVTRAKLIVLPSHGRRGATRLLLGSVAERVTRLANCPVLVLRQ